MYASSKNTENIIEILSNLQEFLRKPIIKNKLEDFYYEEDELQLETINLIIKSISNIKIEEINRLISNWLEVLGTLENVKINKITILFLQEIYKNPALIERISPVITNALKNLDEKTREKLKICFIESLFSVNNYGSIVSQLNKEVLELLEIEQRPKMH